MSNSKKQPACVKNENLSRTYHRRHRVPCHRVGRKVRDRRSSVHRPGVLGERRRHARLPHSRGLGCVSKMIDEQQEPATECNCSRILSGSDRGCGRRRVGPAIAGWLKRKRSPEGEPPCYDELKDQSPPAPSDTSRTTSERPDLADTHPRPAADPPPRPRPPARSAAARRPRRKGGVDERN
jgi:hypothetical protein